MVAKTTRKIYPLKVNSSWDVVKERIKVPVNPIKTPKKFAFVGLKLKK